MIDLINKMIIKNLYGFISLVFYMKQQIGDYFSFYENEILPKIKIIPEVTQKDYGYHGLYTHTEGVVFRGIYFAISMGKNPYPVIFACCGHDLARTNDEDCLKHGPNAVPIVGELIDMFGDLLSSDDKEKVKNAVKRHSIGTIANDYISACLRDADRVRLAWELGYNEKFFNTEIGKKIASGNPKTFLEFENKCLGRAINIDKEGVLISEFQCLA